MFSIEVPTYAELSAREGSEYAREPVLEFFVGLPRVIVVFAVN
jgi:hypothetical protein